MVYKTRKVKRSVGIFRANSFSVTANIIFINIAAFIIAILFGALNSPCDETICRYIAVKPADILQGQNLWTLFTSMFMHGGFFHIFANMFSLFFIGSLVERLLGAKRYLLFYLISGLIAGLAFVLSALVFPADLNVYAVGASGALFSLVGFLMVITPNLPVFVMFIPIPIKMKYAAPGLLVVLWLISVTTGLGIGNVAHAGGLVAGLIYALFIKNKYRRKTAAIAKYFS